MEEGTQDLTNILKVPLPKLGEGFRVRADQVVTLTAALGR